MYTTDTNCQTREWQNNPQFFSMNDSFKNTPRPNWEILTDWGNGL